MKTIFLSFSIRNTSVTEYFLELSNQLSQSYKIIVVADNLEPHPFYISPLLTIVKWPSLKPKRYRDFLFLVKLVRKHRPVMMISNFSSVSFFLTAGYLLRVKNRIAWCHSISVAFQAKPLSLFRKKIIYKLATLVVANSNATKMDLIKNFSVTERKIEIFPNAVRLPDVPVKPFDKNQILYVGGMRAAKGVDVLLKAMPVILEILPDVRLKLVGNLRGPQVKNLQSMAKELKIDDYVSFVGSFPKQKVLEEFSTSYLTVVPSIVEAFGYVVIESFSMKTPVIGSCTTGIAEIIRDEVDGYLFIPGNHYKLADKIITLFQNRDLRMRLSENCFQRFLDEYEVVSTAKRIIERIDKLNN